MTTINAVEFNMKTLEPVGTHRNVPNEEIGTDESFISDMGYTGLVLRMTGYEKTLAKYDEVINEFMKPGGHTLIYRTGWQFTVYSTQLVPLLDIGIVDNFFPYELILLTGTPYRESSTLSCRKKAITANNQEWSAEDMSCNNLLDNWSFEDWSDGVNTVPDGWSSGYSTIARSTTHVIGLYSVEITPTSGSARIIQNPDDYEQYRGRYMSAGALIKSTAAANLRISNSGGSSGSGYHSGSGNWEWVTATAYIDPAATDIRLWVYAGSDTIVCYVDGAVLIEGDSIPDNGFIRDIDTDGVVDAVPDITITAANNANALISQTEKWT